MPFSLSLILSTIRAAKDVVLNRRIQEKRKILLEELSSADASMLYAITEDELLACIYQFDIAAMKGAAVYKLKLMARVLRGQVEAGPLVADEFFSNSEMIASLRQEEIKLVATLHRVWNENSGVADFSERMTQTMISVYGELVPKVFASIDAMNSVAVAVQRTGLIVYTGNLTSGDVPENLVMLRTTARMVEFAQLARIETLGIEW